MFLFLFLFLLVSFWVVAAWLMTEHTNMGVAVFVADNTSMCGIWSDGAAAVLSSCSLVRCSSHQFVSPYREVLLQGTHPPCTISCGSHRRHCKSQTLYLLIMRQLFYSKKQTLKLAHKVPFLRAFSIMVSHC